jgi:hypothetical protein
MNRTLRQNAGPWTSSCSCGTTSANPADIGLPAILYGTRLLNRDGRVRIKAIRQQPKPRTAPCASPSVAPVRPGWVWAG